MGASNALGVVIHRRHEPSGILHDRNDPSTAADTRLELVNENIKSEIDASWPTSEQMRSHEVASHILMIPLVDPVARNDPHGVNSKQVIRSTSSCKRCSRLPESGSHIAIEPSLDRVARVVPSADSRTRIISDAVSIVEGYSPIPAPSISRSGADWTDIRGYP